MVDLRVEKQRDELAPSMPFVDFFVGDSLTPIRIVPDFLEEFYEDRYANGRSRAKFVLFDPVHDFLENAIIINRNRVRYEFGWTGAELGSRARSVIRDGLVVSTQPTFSYQGNRLEIEVVTSGDYKNEGVDMRFFFEDANGRITTAKPNSRAAQEIRTENLATVSKVVQYLADEMNLLADIEPTSGKFLLLQQAESNFSFIGGTLQMLAKNKAGQKDYNFSVEGALLTFKRPKYEVRRRYWFAKDILGTMIKFSPVIAKNQIWDGSWTDRIGVGFSPLDKKIVRSRVSNVNENWKDKRFVPLGSRTLKGSRTPDKHQPGRLYVTPYDDGAFMLEYTRAKHREMWNNIATAEATVVGDPDISPNDLIDVVVLTNLAEVHYTSGVYRVVEVLNKMQMGSFVTDLKLTAESTLTPAGVENFGEIQRELRKFFNEQAAPDPRFQKKSNIPPVDLKDLLRVGGKGGLGGITGVSGTPGVPQ